MNIFKIGLSIAGIIAFGYLVSEYTNKDTFDESKLNAQQIEEYSNSAEGEHYTDPYTSEIYYPNHTMQAAPDNTIRDLATGALVGHLLTKGSANFNNQSSTRYNDTRYNKKTIKPTSVTSKATTPKAPVIPKPRIAPKKVFSTKPSFSRPSFRSSRPMFRRTSP